ncbi:MAG TPA: VCBS repeat-containing protein, partial [Thermoanaerobaculia bacterium]|nr:VCBS repeat-containing protein [Thermoanaerobaculia bacterium]
MSPILFAAACLLGVAPSPAQPWHFTEVSVAAGARYATGGGLTSAPRTMGGGAAAGDFDGDGWVDLYVIRIDAPNVLLRNMHDGTFSEVTGNGLNATSGSGPTFADLDGDGRLDLVIGGIDGAISRYFRNLGGGQFAEFPGGLPTNPPDVYSTALGDYDRDGDLDLVTTHWASSPRPRLWRNDGSGTFTEVPTAVTGFSPGPTQIFSFTPNFTDINNDGWPDLLLSADFGTSQTYINNRNGSFTRTTDSAVITDENGMGSAIGDYDHDGDLDWFVSSIFEPSGASSGSWGTSGNRLYRNRGDGSFEDVTTLAGVRAGYWGWGSSFSDFNNDGNLDIFHVNGFPGSPFVDDPSRMFVSNGDGTFTQMAETLGIADTGEGRGIVV